MTRTQTHLLTTIGALVAVGLVMVLSASMNVAHARFGSPLFFLQKQVNWVLLGAVAFLVTMHVDYRRWYRLAPAAMAFSLLLLAGVLLPGLGVQMNGARRWMRFAGFGIQPSELARIGIVLFFAWYACARQADMAKFFRGAVPGLAILCLTCGIVAIEPDVGTAGLIGIVGITLLAVGGLRLWQIVLCGIPALAGGGALLVHKLPHVQARLQAFLHPELDPLGKALQQLQSMYAIGSGGLTGRGLGESIGKMFYVPEAYNDFIFAVIGEEMGLAGSLIVLGLFAALLLLCLRVICRAPDLFAMLITLGLSLFVGIQVFINVAVVTFLMPAKGISLPFVSYGGSTIVFTLASLGIVLNIAGAADRAYDAAHPEKAPEPEPAPPPALPHEPIPALAAAAAVAAAPAPLPPAPERLPQATPPAAEETSEVFPAELDSAPAQTQLFQAELDGSDASERGADTERDEDGEEAIWLAEDAIVDE